MAKLGSIIGKLAAGALALGGLVLAGKTGFGKNIGEQTEDKDPLALEPLGGDLDDDGPEETAPEEEEGDEEA